MCKLNLLLQLQLILASIILVLALFIFRVSNIPRLTLIFILMLALLTLAFTFSKNKKKWYLIPKEFLAALMPIPLIVALKLAFTFFLKNVADLQSLFVVIYSILAISLFLPYLQLVLVKMNYLFSKLLAIFVLMECVLNLLVNGYHFNSSLLFAINDSSIVNSFLFFGFAIYLSKKWWQRINFNLQFSATPKSQWLSLLVLAVVIVWSLFFSVLIYHVSQLSDAIWNWQITLSELKELPALNLVLAAVEAAILEETVRYLNIQLVLRRFSSQKMRVELSIVISSLIFANDHIVNYFVGQSAIVTAVQVFQAFAFGLFLASIYLYTGKFWLLVLIHTLQDFIIFWINANPLADMSAAGWWLS